MARRYKERRYHRRRRDNYYNPGRTLSSALRRPTTQIALLLIVGLVIFLILQVGNKKGSNTATGLPGEISVSEAYTKYQTGAFFLDVRTQEEWNEFHAPNATLIPLDQLPTRLSELPKDKEIVVVCRSGTCSQQGREILLNAGFTQVTSMQDGLTDWRTSGYPIQP
ncbi:MAG TPA: rhodanese-like domain-containing protein [Anaerolineales bacterium]